MKEELEEGCPTPKRSVIHGEDTQNPKGEKSHCLTRGKRKILVIIALVIPVLGLGTAIIIHDESIIMTSTGNTAIKQTNIDAQQSDFKIVTISSVFESIFTQFMDDGTQNKSDGNMETDDLYNITGNLTDVQFVSVTTNNFSEVSSIASNVSKFYQDLKNESNEDFTDHNMSLLKDGITEIYEITTIDKSPTKTSTSELVTRATSPVKKLPALGYHEFFNNLEQKKEFTGELLDTFTLAKNTGFSLYNTLYLVGDMLWFPGWKTVSILDQNGRYVQDLSLPDGVKFAPKCVIQSMFPEYIFVLYVKARGITVVTKHGRYLKTVSYADLCDITEYENTIFGLDYRSMQIHIYHQNRNQILVHVNHFQRSQKIHVPYGYGYILDNLRVTKYLYYISSWSRHALYIYQRITDQYRTVYTINQYSTTVNGKYGISHGYVNPGWLFHPILTSIDSNGNAVVVDMCNKRIQYLSSDRVWTVLVLSTYDLQVPQTLAAANPQNTGLDSNGDYKYVPKYLGNDKSDMMITHAVYDSKNLIWWVVKQEKKDPNQCFSNSTDFFLYKYAN